MRERKTLAMVTAVAVVAGVPLTVAVLHQGFPVNAVELDTRDVWVTNGEKLLGGRLNHQIDELDAAVTGSSSDLDVLQDGSAYFLTDLPHGTVRRGHFITLIGDGVTVDELGHHFGTIGYEVLTSLGRRYARDYRGNVIPDSKTTPERAASENTISEKSPT